MGHWNYTSSCIKRANDLFPAQYCMDLKIERKMVEVLVYKYGPHYEIRIGEFYNYLLVVDDSWDSIDDRFHKICEKDELTYDMLIGLGFKPNK